MGVGGLERSRRIPWRYQRLSLVKPRDSSTALRPFYRLRFAQNDTAKDASNTRQLSHSHSLAIPFEA